MKYSLLSRFQGCLEGMAIADQLGLWVQQLPTRPLHHWHPGTSPSGNLAKLQPSAWVELAFQVADSLVQVNGWSVQASSGAETLQLAADTSARLAIATVPIALFYHDDLSRQQHQLRQTVRDWGGTPEMEDWVAIFGYAIAQALNERLIPRELLSRLVSHLNTVEPDWHQRSPAVASALDVLEALLEGGTGLTATSSKIDQLLSQDAKTMVLALYCFLCTPDQWHLSVVHAVHLLPASPELCTLTACLSGAYNSHSSLPLAWKVAFHQSAASMPVSQVSSVTCAEQATRLLASWSGMFEASPRLATKLFPVTSPHL